MYCSLGDKKTTFLLIVASVSLLFSLMALINSNLYGVCWDINGDRRCNYEEDINHDGVCDAYDCRGMVCCTAYDELPVNTLKLNDFVVIRVNGDFLFDGNNSEAFGRVKFLVDSVPLSNGNQVSISYYVLGDLATLSIPEYTDLTVNLTLGSYLIPVEFRPIHSVSLPLSYISNGDKIIGTIDIYPNGTIFTESLINGWKGTTLAWLI
jgi:hypothetical protein